MNLPPEFQEESTKSASNGAALEQFLSAKQGVVAQAAYHLAVAEHAFQRLRNRSPRHFRYLTQPNDQRDVSPAGFVQGRLAPPG